MGSLKAKTVCSRLQQMRTTGAYTHGRIGQDFSRPQVVVPPAQVRWRIRRAQWPARRGHRLPPRDSRHKPQSINSRIPWLNLSALVTTAYANGTHAPLRRIAS
jgi:hypothetical protein